MLYIFFGTDTDTVRAQALDRVRSLVNAESESARITASDYRPGIFAEKAGSVSLFGSTNVTTIDTLSEDSEAFAALIDELPMLSRSEHVFVVIEHSLKAAERKAFQAHAAECAEYAAEKETQPNRFALTDALLERDKRTAWLLLAQALSEGTSSEEIAGLLFWQVKTLRLVARTNSAEEAGLKPFVYSKAKRSLGRFKPQELDRLSEELVTLYHEGHRGMRDMDLALERWVLSL